MEDVMEPKCNIKFDIPGKRPALRCMVAGQATVISEICQLEIRKGSYIKNAHIESKRGLNMRIVPRNLMLF
jgi:hypothetical protein